MSPPLCELMWIIISFLRRPNWHDCYRYLLKQSGSVLPFSSVPTCDLTSVQKNLWSYVGSKKVVILPGEWLERDLIWAFHPCCFVCIKMNVLTYAGKHGSFCMGFMVIRINFWRTWSHTIPFLYTLFWDQFNYFGDASLNNSHSKSKQGGNDKARHPKLNWMASVVWQMFLGVAAPLYVLEQTSLLFDVHVCTNLNW
jgi:hypothetical protein